MSETTVPTQPQESVDLSPFMMKVGRKDYLTVAGRIYLLRHLYPDAVTTMEQVEINSKIAIFKATVTLPNGAHAEDYGTETPADFGDYIEKAATKAMGRALAQVGLGTQFVDDFDMNNGDGTPHVVDSPQQVRRAAAAPKAAAGEAPAKNSSKPSGYECSACGKEIKASMIKETGEVKYTAATLAAMSVRKTGEILCYTCGRDKK